MGLIRTVLALLAAGLLAAGLVGLLSNQSFDDGDGFAASVAGSLSDPTVNAEVKAEVKDTVVEAVESAGQSGGVLGSLAAGFAADGIGNQAAELVDTPEFTRAFQDWALLLHQGFADYASNTPNQQVQITPHDIRIEIEPLIAPIAGDVAADSASEILEAVGQDATLQLETGVDLRVLKAVHALGQVAWILLGAAAVSLLLVVALGPNRLRWLGIGLLISGGVIGVLAALLVLVQGLGNPESDYPALSEAIVAAILRGWVETTAIVALATAGIGFLALAVSAMRRPHGPTA